MTVSVDDEGLRGLVRTARAVQDEAGRARDALPDGGAAALGYVAAVHATVRERWFDGLRVAVAASAELGEKVEACRTEYAAVDDDAAVTFTGLDR